MATINKFVGTILLAIFAIVVVILLAYALYQYALFGSYLRSVGVNPYCVRQLCTPDGTQTSAYTSAPVDDPTRGAYQTLTYCLLNAPPCELIKQMSVCSNTDFTTEELEQILKFYNEDYYPRCNYGFGGGNQVTTNPNAGDPDVNSTPLVNGPNDDFLRSLLSCSQKIDPTIVDNPNWISLNRACGSQCENSS